MSLGADYPARALRLVVPFPPGGALDILARGLTPKLATQLGQQIVIDNRPGANGVLGFDVVAKAPADGYTLLMGFATGVAVNPLLIPNLPYDSAKDFAPVAIIARNPMILIASATFPSGSVQELIALAKSTPGKISYGTPGVGNPNHLAGELFKSITGVNLVHTPYKGAALVINDLIGGHLPVAFVTLPAAVPQLRSAKIKALAITSERRSIAAPDVPTMAEAGVAGLDFHDWGGILVPAGTPAAVIARLNGEINRVVSSPEIHSRFNEQGLEPLAMTAAEFAALIRSDTERLAKIVKQAGIRAE
jgi:tripartite-type tricarboxylate transporter receptor subunit TctC